MKKHLDQLWSMGARHLCFQDDCLTVDRDAFLDLCRILKEYNFACFGTTRADCIDQEIVEAAYDAGFYEFAIGIEHGSQRMLDAMHKKTNLDAAFKAREFCRKAGISFTALMMEGYPGETAEDRQENKQFLAKLDPDCIGTIGHIMVLPGTKLYRQCRDAGLLNDDFWLGNEPYFTYQGGLHGANHKEIVVEQETGTIELETQTDPVVKQNELGVAAYEQGQVATAQEHFEQAIRLDGTYIAARRNLADLFSQEGKIDVAVTQLKAILDLAPNDVEALSGLGSLCITMKYFDDAFFFFSRALELNKGDATLVEIVETLKAKGYGAKAHPESEWTAEQDPIVSVIIPVFNNFAYTKKCLESIFSVKETTTFEVIVVDDASTDGSSDSIRQLPFPVRIVRHEQNKGFAISCNDGAKAAVGKYVLFLNNDTVVLPGWMDALKTCLLDDSSVGLVGNLQIFPDTGKVQQAGIVCGENKMVYSIYNNELPHDHPAVNKPREFQLIAGSCMMLEKDFFFSVGGFDQSYVNSCEDVDLCMKVRQAGKKVFYCPESRILHFESKTVSGHDKSGKNYQLFLERWGNKMFKDDHLYLKADGVASSQKSMASFSVLKHRDAIEIARDELQSRGSNVLDPNIQREFAAHGYVPRVGDKLKSWDVLKTLNFLEQHIERSSPVLDIGTFCSEIPCSLHRMKFENLAGIDLNPEVKRMPYCERINYTVGDFFHTPFPDASFSAITAISVIEHGFKSELLLEELSRLLSPGGFFIASVDYWKEKISTDGLTWFDMDWRIFSKEEMLAFFDQAARYGLYPIGSMDFETGEKAISWNDREYTFAWFVLQKKGETASAAIVSQKPSSKVAREKIALLSTFNQVCGISSHTGFIVDALQKALRKNESFDPEILVLAESDVPTITHDSRLVIRCWRRNDENFDRALDAILKHGVTILHIQFQDGIFEHTELLSFVRKCSSHGVKVFITFHSVERVLSHCATLVNESFGSFVHLEQNRVRLAGEGADTTRIQIVPLGVLDRWKSNVSLEVAKRKLNIPSDVKVVSSFGFLEPHKGIAEIIKSLPEVARKHNAMYFHVGGGHPGNPKSSEYLRNCNEEAERLGVSDRVNFISSYMSEEEVSKHLLASDVIVMNYQINRNEASAAVTSAMAHGRPIITTAMPPFKALANCTLQLSDNLPLDAAICAVLEKPSLRRYLVEQMDAYVTECSYDQLAIRLMESYGREEAISGYRVPCIGIDARTFYYSDSVSRGIGHYSLYHLKHAAQLKQDWKFVLFGEPGPVPKILEQLVSLPNVQLKSVEEYNDHEVDLVHVCDSMNILGGFDSPYRTFKARKSTVTFYDLTPMMLYLQSWPEAQRRSYQQRLDQLKSSNATVLAISQYTKNDLVSKTAFPAERAEVIMAGLNSAGPVEMTMEKVDEVKSRLGITKPFFLHVGALDPHKKFDTALKAFVECSRRTKCQLVVVGQMEYYIKAYADYVKQNKIKNVIFTGFIAREDLEVLYSEARALVFMSMYEGFGFPVLEAMAKGCPVITSNATSVPEVAGDAALMFGPDDVGGVSQAMLQLLRNEALRSELGKKGLEQSGKFTWDECARKTVAIWEKMVGIGGKTHAASQSRPPASVSDSMSATRKIALPPGARPQILYHSALYDPSGYADEGRNFILGLQQHGFDIAAREIGRHSEQFKRQLDAGTRKSLDQLLAKQQANGCVSVVHFPGYAFQRVPGAAYNIGRTMFETDSLPADWVVRCNMMDEVWVPSDFNVETFRSAGVTTTLVKIPGGIDTDQFRPGVAPMKLKGVRGKVFLSVFEWSYRKGWDVLLDGWVNAFKHTDDVCLVLRTYPVNATDNKNVKQEIESRIDSYLKSKHSVNRSQVAPIIVLGNQISEADMPSLFAAADVYLAPSRGEGWGRPQMSAMAMGLPVIATRWSGNLEFMNDANSFLIDVDGLTTIDDRMENSLYRGQQWAQPSVENFASLLRRVVEHPDEANAIGEHARADMENKWSWKVVAQKISERVDQISSQLYKVTTGIKPAVLPSVVWEGPQFANSSLALVNRELCKGLVANGHEFSSLHVGSKEFAPEVGSVVAKIQAAENVTIKNPDIHVRHHWPPNLNPPESGRWVVIQPWEFGSLPKEWVEVFTTQVDECWVYSRYVQQVYVSSGVPASKVVVVPLGVDAQKFHPGVKPFSLKTKKKFRFLFVGGTIFRKGIDLLIEAYTNAFTKLDDVCLVIKDFGGETFYKGQTIKGTIAQIRSRKDAPEIEYIDRVLSDEEIAGVYTACDVLVHPYRGEGFGLPILEAMACGTPTIVTDGGAALDFCNATNSLLVKAETKRLAEKKVGDLETVDYPWMFEVDRAALVSAMRYAVDNPEAIAALGSRAQSDVHANWTWEKSFEAMKRQMDLLKTKPIFRFSAALALQQASEMLVGAGRLYHEKKYHETLHVLRLVAKTLEQQVPAEERVLLTANLESFRGDCYLQLEMLDEAKESYERALHGNPESSQACAGIGQILYLKGFDEQAKAMFEWAVKNDPSNQMAMRGLATVNEILGLPPAHSALSEAASSEGESMTVVENSTVA